MFMIAGMARYDSMRKIERNKALYEYVERHPDLSMKEVGEVFGVCTSRVSRLLSQKRKADRS